MIRKSKFSKREFDYSLPINVWTEKAKELKKEHQIKLQAVPSKNDRRIKNFQASKKEDGKYSEFIPINKRDIKKDTGINMRKDFRETKNNFRHNKMLERVSERKQPYQGKKEYSPSEEFLNQLYLQRSWNENDPNFFRKNDTDRLENILRKDITGNSGEVDSRKEIRKASKYKGDNSINLTLDTMKKFDEGGKYGIIPTPGIDVPLDESQYAVQDNTKENTDKTNYKNIAWKEDRLPTFKEVHIDRTGQELVQVPQDHGSVDEYKSPSLYKQFMNKAANPLSALSDRSATRVGTAENPYDIPLELINPFSWARYAHLSKKQAQRGNIAGAGLNALGVLGAVPAMNSGKNVLMKSLENYKLKVSTPLPRTGETMGLIRDMRRADMHNLHQYDDAELLTPNIQIGNLSNEEVFTAVIGNRVRDTIGQRGFLAAQRLDEMFAEQSALKGLEKIGPVVHRASTRHNNINKYNNLFSSSLFSSSPFSPSTFSKRNLTRKKIDFIRYLKTGKLNPKAVFYNLQNELQGDVWSSAMFNMSPDEAKQFIKGIETNIPKGGQWRERSLSGDSFRLILPAISRNKNILDIKHSGQFNGLNGFAKKIPKHLIGSKTYEEDMVELLNKHLKRFNTQTNANIPDVKIINNRVYVPDIIAQKKGASLKQQMIRNEPLIKTGLAGTAVGSQVVLLNKLQKDIKEGKIKNPLNIFVGSQTKK